MVLGHFDDSLDLERVLDKGCDKSGNNVPLNMAVEKPDAWGKSEHTRLVTQRPDSCRKYKPQNKHTRIAGLEAEDHVPIRIEHKSIPSHRSGREVGGAHVRVGKGAGLLFGTPDGLEGVAVEMEGMSTGVEVVNDNFDDLILLQDEAVGMGAVDLRIRGEIPGAHHSIERGHFRGFVRDVVEPSAVVVLAGTVGQR